MRRTTPVWCFHQNERAGDWRLGALAAVLALAEPAVDADRVPSVFSRSMPADRQFRGMADFTTEAERETRLRLRMRAIGRRTICAIEK